jgi:hypothetical protein
MTWSQRFADVIELPDGRVVSAPDRHGDALYDFIHIEGLPRRRSPNPEEKGTLVLRVARADSPQCGHAGSRFQARADASDRARWLSTCLVGWRDDLSGISRRFLRRQRREPGRLSRPARFWLLNAGHASRHSSDSGRQLSWHGSESSDGRHRRTTNRSRGGRTCCVRGYGGITQSFCPMREALSLIWTAFGRVVPVTCFVGSRDPGPPASD